MKEILWGRRASAPILKINGREYPLRLSEAELLRLISDVRQSFRRLSSEEASADAIIAAAENAAEAIDRILGQGALEALADGRPVSIPETLRLLDRIVAAAMEEYADRVAELHA